MEKFNQKTVTEMIRVILRVKIMDNLQRPGPEDPKKINVNQPWEIDYWTKELGISKEKLRSLVKKVGPEVSNVKEELKREKNRLKRNQDGWGR